MKPIKKTCTKCDEEYNHLRQYKGHMLCYKCYQKESVWIVSNPFLFDEPVDNNTTVHIPLTKSQKEFLNKRVKELGFRKCHYFREFLLADMYQFEERLERKGKNNLAIEISEKIRED